MQINQNERTIIKYQIKTIIIKSAELLIYETKEDAFVDLIILSSEVNLDSCIKKYFMILATSKVVSDIKILQRAYSLEFNGLSGSMPGFVIGQLPRSNSCYR